jgi:GT2 family glycosyltransferase/tetratricopeptide (TPR) repeat protein
MALRCLFGPVTGAFADQNLNRPRSVGDCLAFGPDGNADLTIKPGDSWEEVRRQLPAGWEPDLLTLHLAYGSIPGCLWRAPLPKVGLATDWNLLWHYYRGRLSRCDLVLTDAAGAEALAREGIAAQAAALCGCDRGFVEEARPTSGLRDIDVLFVGNLNPAVQRERVPWLTRLARMGRRWRVQIRTGIFGEPYRRLLNRARIVFQFSARGKAGRRAFEAANAGALIFQEAANRELPAYFRDRQECVYYGPDDLEDLIAYYLEHEPERRALAEAGRVRAQSCRFEELWGQEVAVIEKDWPGLRDQAGRPDSGDPRQELHTRSWQALAAGRFEDVSLIADLERTLKAAPDAAFAANLMGCMLWRQGRGRTPAAVLGGVAFESFHRALAAQSNFTLAGLNEAESLEAAGRRPEAVERARHTLAAVRRSPELDPASLEGMPLCQAFDLFHVEWERAAWSSAGRLEAEARAKRDLIQWRLHSQLAAWTGDLTHHYEATLLRPDLSGARSALGQALTRADRPADGLEHLRRALADNPLDADAARALFEALGAANDLESRRLLREDRRLLAQAVPQAAAAEGWFAESRPRGNELVSLILLCGDQPEAARLCLESLLRNTRPPYELIVVERGPSGDAAAPMQQLLSRPGPSRVEVVRNETEPGFALGCNEGLARSRGRYIVFLDGETVLTPHWLEALIALALHDWPSVGLVGPVANAAPAPQAVAEDYPGLNGLDGFAAQRRRTWGGRMTPVNRLGGFCLLTRREVLDRIGGLDERFGIGPYADADLCLRAREAGLRLLLAQDVFIHHSGGAGQSQADDERRRADENLVLLRDKWGAELAAPFQPAAETTDVAAASIGAVASADDSTKKGVSLCMIVRNEEINLPECLRTVEGLFDETVVVDTGSTDGTREAAARLGAKLFEFPWVDSFGAARNECIRHASGKWILWLDADDRLDAENRERLRKVLAGLGDERDAYAVQVRSVLDSGATTFRLLDQVRIFRNLPEIRWDYRIHEQILPAVNRAGGVVRWTDVIVDHVGYQDADVRRRKLERNLRLLEMDETERPDDSFSLFNLGWTLLDLGRIADALPRLRRGLETAKPDSSILRKLHHLLAVGHRQSNAPEEALQACREGLKRFPDDAELLLEEGLMLRDRGDLVGVEQSWSKLFEPRRGKYFSSEEVGLRGFRTRQLLAEIFARQERWTEAEVQWRAALEERPDFEPAWEGLGELYLRLARWPDLEELLQRLEGQVAARPKVGWLRARGQVQRKEYAAARRTLAEVIAQDPRALGPRVLLSQALLQEGRDWTASEKALQDVLEIDAENKDAQHNLQILRRQRSRPTPALAPGK